MRTYLKQGLGEGSWATLLTMGEGAETLRWESALCFLWQGRGERGSTVFWVKRKPAELNQDLESEYSRDSFMDKERQHLVFSWH